MLILLTKSQSKTKQKKKHLAKNKGKASMTSK